MVRSILVSAVLVTTACAATRPPDRDALEARVSRARSPEDHLAIASYYRREARSLRGRLEDHRQLAHVYDRRSAWAEEFRARQVAHCTAAAARLGGLMSDYEELARAHEEEAKRIRMTPEVEPDSTDPPTGSPR